MSKEWKARNPNYFFVLFGEKHASAHPVEGGVYPDRKGWKRISNLGMAPGDVLLLYCGGKYPGHKKEAPGVGVVIDIETDDGVETIDYQFLPLDQAIPWNPIIKGLPAVTAHQPLRYIGNWVFQLSSASFSMALVGRQIKWP